MEIYLTFDDGPDPAGTPNVLASLRRARTVATFFVIAPKARRYPRLISEMQRAGHRVEFHCAEHIRHTERTREEIEEDTSSGLRDLKALGIEPGIWRTPWGVTESWTGEVADRFGLELTSWTADTHDWRRDTAPEMLKSVASLLRPDAIVLMHDGLGPGARRTDCAETAALVEPLVHRVRALGCEPSTMKITRRASLT
ncbi:hypothetical protein BH24ACT22_BH24ACT22_04790 [soil metagenome]